MRNRTARLDLADSTGATLLITLLVMLMVFALGATLASSMLTEITSSANYRTRGAALWQADAGLERVAMDLLADPQWAREMVDYSTLPMTVTNFFPMNSTINGMTVTYTDDGSGQPVPQFYALGNPVTLDDGSFQRQIFMPPVSIEAANGSGTKAWLIVPVGAQGNSGVVEPSTTRVHADMRVVVRRLTIWDNAIFGGASQGGNSINGNVQVRGSMHVVGPASDIINSGGTAFVMNSYRNWLIDYGPEAAKLPPLPVQEFNGEMVQTLDSEVRVKAGTINLSGTVQWGLDDVTGNAFKETLDGFYSDATLNLNSIDAEVNADDEGPYDAPGIAFPTLDDPYYDASTATNYATHRDYLNNNSLLLPVNEISVDTPAFNLNDGLGNSIQWNPVTGEMHITGIVRTNGDLDLAKNNNPVHYTGTGTLYSSGTVRIHSNLLPTGDYLNLANPTPNDLGIIADTDLHLATGPGESQIKVMAALYCEDKTWVNKQTNVAGALVSDEFDLGNQVPSVWQVPILSTNLPPGMPGADPLLFVPAADITNWYQVRQ
ncbi:MAG: pilus assembly PilX N-terminal domain-containing protein [Acidobacteriota bacterium]